MSYRKNGFVFKKDGRRTGKDGMKGAGHCKEFLSPVQQSILKCRDGNSTTFLLKFIYLFLFIYKHCIYL